MSTTLQQTNKAEHDTRDRLIAARLTRTARDKALLAKTQMTSIARRCGVNRMTITRHLDGSNLSLAEYLATAHEAGFDPVVEMRAALTDKERE